MSLSDKRVGLPIFLRDLCIKHYGYMPYYEKLPGAGSNREYFRILPENSPSVIATYSEDVTENKTFISLSKVFAERGINVPKVICHDPAFYAYLQEDLGNNSLFNLLAKGEGRELVKDALSLLVKMQTTEEDLWEPLIFSPPFRRRNVLWDLNYFKYDFLKPLNIIFDENKLEDDFEKIATLFELIDGVLIGFMYRDFQSRNIMIKDKHPYFIDFQGGRKGPLVYDAISFIWQAKAGFNHQEKEILKQHYITCLSEARKISKKEIEKDWNNVLLIRTFQVLGAYGFRGLIEKKAHFIESIKGGVDNLNHLLTTGVIDPFPEIKRIAEKIIIWRDENLIERNELCVQVFSFSYKKGYPVDLSGNGGGFMFDCRGMHNPGRYDEYKSLTGKDREVVDFLENKGEVQEFVAKALEMLSPVVSRYKERGFTSLQVGFGCTGGRHRSVYCAERFTRELKEIFPDTNIKLKHREIG